MLFSQLLFEFVPSLKQQKWLVAVWGLVFIGGLKDYLKRAGDLQIYVEMGEVVLRGGNIYRDLRYGLVGAWPPIYSLFCVPLALFVRVTSFPALRLVWVMILLGSLYLTARKLFPVAFGKPFALVPRRGALSPGSPEVFVPLLLTIVFLNDNFKFLQVNIILLAVVVLGLDLIGRNRDINGGILLGLAASLKIIPGIFLPYLLYRRRWVAAISCGSSLILFSIFPALIFGWHKFAGYAASWPEAVGKGWGINGNNQSLFAMCDRFFGQSGGFLSAFQLPPAFVSPSGKPVVQIIYWAIIFLLLFAFVRSVPPRARVNRRFLMLEGAVLYLLAMLASPLAWRHYFIVLLAPITLLYGWVRERKQFKYRDKTLYLVLLILVLVLPSPSGLFRNILSTIWMNYSSVTFTALIIFFLGLWARGSMEVSKK